MTDSMSDQNGVAVITGGASGIGRAFARAYADRGAHVLIGDIDEAATRLVADELAATGARVDTSKLDLRDAASVSEFGSFAEQLGTITAVCLNAGVTSTGTTLWDTSDSAYDFVTDVNMGGLFRSVRVFVPILVNQHRPADIVITASMAGMVASAYSGVYAASKAGAVALAKSLRAELQMVAPAIRVALLNPGMVKTNLIRSSAAQLPSEAAMSAELVDGSHDALNQIGVEPEVAVGWAFDALQQGRFWAMPPEDDPFMHMLRTELSELQEESARS
ncbi:NAD(P)-dependent dehydrogenase (short-subunit alcohol dehydrogenase family) [Mycolicibacterium sp. BK634]|uniref:SDR family NAD(P)-dependent oxidoreductase n=1 Tax=Mycolicibacterium sp. BK634 TaxID=2587099 RepID=UPI0018344C82|nr:NAD(P)-dependent dehydrogenase (short-subunit alcohol dehydrogenase family) [Mycolicibacterium sp. BK634]